MSVVLPNVPHGTYSSYNRGCRCDSCREGARLYNKRLRERRASGEPPRVFRPKSERLPTVVPQLYEEQPDASDRVFGRDFRAFLDQQHQDAMAIARCVRYGQPAEIWPNELVVGLIDYDSADIFESLALGYRKPKLRPFRRLSPITRNVSEAGRALWRNRHRVASSPDTPEHFYAVERFGT